MIPIHHNAGRYSAATSAGILFYLASRAEAEARLRDAGFDPSILDGPYVSDIEWRSTLTAAFANEIASLNDAIAELAPWSDVDAIQEKQAQLEAGMVQLNRQLRIEAIRTEITRTEAELDRQVPIMRKLMGAKAPDWEVTLMVQHGPTGKRLEALLAEWRELMQ